jgi:hypothetical protein
MLAGMAAMQRWRRWRRRSGLLGLAESGSIESTTSVLLQSIRTAVIQAEARFQWGEYDRFRPSLQVHTLLGAGGVGTESSLREAGNGLLTKMHSGRGGEVCT